HDLKVLDEAKLLDLQVEEATLGLVDLNHVEVRSLRAMNVDTSLCQATLTLPFDKVEDTYLVATCYYLSAPVVKYWEEQLERKIIWYGTTTSSFLRALERVEDIHAAEDAAAEEDEEESA